ncbi:hypothetical protein [Pelagerythrobacter marensis]|uniref:hypothetical protein n=1 Tax=Pelagerythrobacter marensis TaxID=543877 RepID=UPI0012377FBE|nr:hypothetical protein [Pelagerythrobacter marensis]
MRRLLVGIALGAAASTLSFIVGGFLSQEKSHEERTVVLFFDGEKSEEYYHSAPAYELSVASIGEKLRDCGVIELHFVPSRGLDSSPFVAVFWDEMNDIESGCVEDIMKSGEGRWSIHSARDAIELGLP